ncbi:MULTISPECIES: hypothetical protein [Enterobacter cloacae complex]|uniref:hypothetical protein n=1 Tax=Enterobacter cloacae complex TaxID=354276 RepID=UPI0003BE1B20|nr:MULTISPECIES: hypothetical protein [Enterobacter cloacae complex]ESN22848.1 hypothetical protein L368_02896 [Enterobacter sp. MGH 22]MCM7477375.1 hypothetical protein [Enterobacter kobei]URL26917.1 hypothetical protein JZY03_18580 [Enterobacter kobei]
MSLPLINQFLVPFEIWQTREPTESEFQNRLASGMHPLLCFESIKTNFIDVINSPEKCAYYLANQQYNKEIDDYIETSLNNPNSNFNASRDAMPSITPAILSGYQRFYNPNANMNNVNNEIVASGRSLADGQVLFHGGALLKGVQVGESLTLTRPLSTSLSPSMAIRNGEWKGKFYHENEANLVILTACSMTHNAFVFKIKGTNKGHEKEVLIQSNAVLKVVSRDLLNTNYKVRAIGNHAGHLVEKRVPFYLTYVTVS